MNLKDQGLIIYIKKINENNLLVKLLSKNNGLLIGIVYGGNSKKNKLVYQIGNFINFNFLKKNENSIGNLNAELSDPLLSDFFEDRYKLLLILTCCALINISVNENQKYQKIYDNSFNLFLALYNKHWFHEFSLWVINFLSELGYGFDWSQIKLKNKYIYLKNLEFINKKDSNKFDNNYIEFPYELILNKTVSYEQCKLLFKIFEYIMDNHLLNNSQKKIPRIYFEFKNVILKSLG